MPLRPWFGTIAAMATFDEIKAQIREHRGPPLRVLGPPGTGKTTCLIERYRALSAEGDVVALSYTRRNVESLTAAVVAANSARLGRSPVSSYHELALEVMSAAPQRLRLLGEMEELVLLDQVLEKVSAQLRSDYQSIYRSDAFHRAVLGVIHTLLRNNVTDADLDRLRDSATAARFQDILAACGEFTAQLRERGLMTYHDVAWRATEVVARDPQLNPWLGVRAVLIDDFGDVDPGQYALVKTLAPPGGRAVVDVFADPTGARFGYRGTSDRFVHHDFPRDFNPTDVILPMRAATAQNLGDVLDRLLGETLPESLRDSWREVEDDGAQAVPLFLAVAEDELAEVGHVAACVAEAIMTGACRPDDIAIVVRDKGRYESPLATACYQHGLVLDSGVRAGGVLEDFLVTLLQLVRAGHAGGERHDDTQVRSMVRSPLFRSLTEVCGERFDDIEPTHPFGMVQRCLSAIRREYAGNNDSFRMASFLSEVVQPCLAERAGMDGDAARLLLTQVNEAWACYDGMQRRTGGRADLRQFLRVSDVLTGGPIAPPGVVGRVGMYSVTEIAGRTFPVVFVLGCSELLFPAPDTREAYIPYALLQSACERALPDRGIRFDRARTRDRHLQNEYALMLTALTRADRQLNLSAPRKFKGDRFPAPSHILERLPERTGKSEVTRKIAPHLDFIRGLTAETRGQDAPATELLGAVGPELRAWTQPRIAPVTFALEQTSLSSHSLTSYTTCERRYFYQYVLKLREDESLPAAVGSLFHKLMELLVEEFPDRDRRRAAIESEASLTAHIARLPLQEQALGGLVADSLRHHLAQMARGLARLESQREGVFQAARVEEKLVVVHKGFEFRGRLDRLDAYDDGALVTIDYKTGETAKTGKTVLKNVLPSCSDPQKRLWQPPLYSRGVEQGGGKRPGAFVYYAIKPEAEAFSVGLFIEGEDAGKPPSLSDNDKKRFDELTAFQLEECLDDAAKVAGELFADRAGFPRTDEMDRCRMCSFARVCERKVQWN